MNEKTTEALVELSKPSIIAAFNPRFVGVEALDQMIGAHQLKYIEALIQAEEEEKLAIENAKDFAKYEPEIQATAFEHAEKAKYDPDYFTRAKIDPEFFMPIQLVGVILSKKEEAKQKTWKAEYHGRLIERLRNFKTIAASKEPKTIKSFIKNLFS